MQCSFLALVERHAWPVVMRKEGTGFFFFFFGFPPGVWYPHWSPTKSGFASESPTLRGKMLPNKGDSVPKGTRTRDLLVKNEGVFTTLSQPLLV
ncbi:hypothetical protein H5410_004476, partial [Solanum commersonii]